jgi:AAA domain
MINAAAPTRSSDNSLSVSGKLSEMSAQADNTDKLPNSRTAGMSGTATGIHAAQSDWRILSSEEFLKELESASEQTQLWGSFLIKGAAVLLVGEASAGKTVFTYRLAQALAQCSEFLGIVPPKALRVLQVDLESPPSVKEDHLADIAPCSGWDFAVVSADKVMPMLMAKGNQYDVIIVDSLQVASPVRDENDNAEANRQMTPFVNLARSSQAAVILVHNAGEGNPKEKFKARGATARVDRADIVMNLDDLGQDKRKLKIVKTRFNDLGATLEFEFAPGLTYKVTKSFSQAPTKQGQMQQRILAALSTPEVAGKSIERKTLAQLLNVSPSSAEERLFERALHLLVRDEKVLHPTQGTYGLPGANQAIEPVLAQPEDDYVC